MLLANRLLGRRREKGIGMRMRSRARVPLVATVVVASMLLAPAAMAHPVSEFGEPDCFGLRISHGSASFNGHEGHELTPGERVAMLQEVVDFILGGGGTPEDVELVEAFFGETVSMQEFIRFVKVNCSDDPILLPF